MAGWVLDLSALTFSLLLYCFRGLGIRSRLRLSVAPLDVKSLLLMRCHIPRFWGLGMWTSEGVILSIATFPLASKESCPPHMQGRFPPNQDPPPCQLEVQKSYLNLITLKIPNPIIYVGPIIIYPGTLFPIGRLVKHGWETCHRSSSQDSTELGFDTKQPFFKTHCLYIQSKRNLDHFQLCVSYC